MGIGLGQLKGGQNGPGALNEKRDRGIPAQRRALRQLIEAGQAERWHREFVFSAEVQHSAARHHYFHTRAGHQYLLDERGRRHHLLKVIQQKEKMLLAQSDFHRL